MLNASFGLLQGGEKQVGTLMVAGQLFLQVIEINK